MSEDARLQLAFTGLHPDTLRGLMDAHGVAGALARVAAADNERMAAAARVEAADRKEQLDARGITYVLREQPGYPQRLGELPGAPDLLFVRGSIPEVPSVAVVGTRRCSAYGRNLAEAYGAAIARAGWSLVSGLARGIDGAAHRGTVSQSGLGVAVLGCGLDIDYPREHAELARRLVALGGAVVSEYPPGTPPEAWRFPPRNRIISGMSRAVVVVEAAIKGGALITANAALDQGVAVFATPGDVGRDSAEGCNMLIRDGAQPVLDPSDLVEELELLCGPADLVVARQHTWAWEGITVDAMARSQGLSVAEAAATLARAESAGVLVREGDRFYPRP